MNQLYRKLMELVEEHGYNTADKTSKQLYNLQRDNLQEIISLIGEAIITYSVVDDALKLSPSDKKKLRKRFAEAINEALRGEYKLEKDVIEDILFDGTEESYNLKNYVYNLGISFKFSPLEGGKILEIVNKTVDKERWSDRLWKNKKQTEKDLKKEIESFLNGNAKVRDIKKKIKNKYSQNAYNTKRLVDSEIARCQNAVNDEFCKEHDIEYQLYSATLDKKVCKKCAATDGEVYEAKDKRKPEVPRHPLCRCCYINLPSKDWKPTNRRNNEVVGEHINWVDYEEWLKVNDELK